MPPTGPLYCETGHPWLFMAEPVNTVTNIFIVAAAVFALLRVRRARLGHPLDLAVLVLLLFATGIGSFFWHAFRTRIALTFDALPGLLFLFAFAGFWINALAGRIAAIILVFGLPLGAFAAMALSALYVPATGPLVFVPAFILIFLMGLSLAAWTARRYGVKEGWFGAAIVCTAALAAIFRSVDLLVCRLVPFGTHFLWHILLSLAAYLAILLLIRLKTMRRI